LDGVSSPAINPVSVLLINPPVFLLARDMRSGAGIPSGLLSIAAVLNAHGYRALVYNADFEGSVRARSGRRGHASRGLGAQEIWSSVREVMREHRPGAVGISFATGGLAPAIELARLVKEIDPGVWVIAGGIHPTARPEEVLSSPGFDVAVCGEGEYTTLEVIRAREQGRPLGDVPGIAYRDEGRVVGTGRRSRIDDLDQIPVDYRDLLIDVDLYPREALGYIWTSRGCPFSCAYCSSAIIWGGEVRFRSPEHVVEELGHVFGRYGVRDFRFIDDNFTYHPRRVTRICEGILDRGLRISWSCCSRADLAMKFSPDLLRLMRRSGCRRICIGFESGSQQILDSVGRGVSLSDMAVTLGAMKRAGIGIHADFIIGMPGESSTSLAATFDLVRRVGEGAGATLSIARFRPYPGTPLSEDQASRDPGARTVAAPGRDQPVTDGEIDRWVEMARQYAEVHNVRVLARSPTFVLGRLRENLRSPRGMAGLVSRVVRSYLARSRPPAGPCCRQ
jgi:anaerobic magnesium-protoporphyrin IX monomethyl ester cyclase